MRRTIVLALLLSVSSVSLAFAQAVTSGTGAVNGKVTDASQAVMPGVTVTLTSPSQMGVRTAVSDSDEPEPRSGATKRRTTGALAPEAEALSAENDSA